MKHIKLVETTQEVIPNEYKQVYYVEETEQVYCTLKKKKYPIRLSASGSGTIVVNNGMGIDSIIITIDGQEISATRVNQYDMVVDDTQLYAYDYMGMLCVFITQCEEGVYENTRIYVGSYDQIQDSIDVSRLEVIKASSSKGKMQTIEHGEGENITVYSDEPIITISAFENNKLTWIEIPSGAKLTSNSFAMCPNLETISLPNGVETIPSGAFSYCYKLSSIEIPNTVTSIGSDAFNFCTSLIEIELPSSLTTIYERAFENCKNLTTINIPQSVTEVGYGAFFGCDALPVENSVRYADTCLVGVTDNTLSSYTLKDGIRFLGGRNESDYRSGGLGANKVIASFDIPNTVVSVQGTFSYCSNLTSVTIPNTVTIIGHGTFNSCSKIETITIPSSVKKIMSMVFYSCTSLATINYDGTIEEWQTMEREDGWYYNILATEVNCSNGTCPLD